MAKKSLIPGELELGARVRIKNYPGPAGKIVELRGPLGPGGMNIYRVASPQKPGISLVELRGNQLELLAPTPRKGLAIKLKKPTPLKLRIKRGHGSNG